MKKIIVIMVMLLSGIVANAQETKRDIQNSFKNGHFYLFVDSDYNTLWFDIVKGTEKYDNEGDIWSGEFITKVEDEFLDSYRKGNDWLKAKIEDKNLNEDQMFIVLYKTFKDYGMLLDEYSITEDGRVKMSFILDE